jgi:arylsulfatase A-like enzyme
VSRPKTEPRSLTWALRGAFLAVLWMQGEAVGNRLGGNLTPATALHSMTPALLFYLAVAALLGVVWSRLFRHRPDDGGITLAFFIVVSQWGLVIACAPSLQASLWRTPTGPFLQVGLPVLLVLTTGWCWRWVRSDLANRTHLGQGMMSGAVLGSAAVAALFLNQLNPFDGTWQNLRGYLFSVGAALVCAAFIAYSRDASMRRRIAVSFVGVLWMVLVFRVGPAHKRKVHDPGLGTPAYATAEAAHPDILLLVVDTLRADHLGAYGDRRSLSPHIDRLAGDGITFERCYSTSPWTLPSMASLLTGHWPQIHGAGRDPRTSELRYTAMHEHVPSLSEQLSQVGYRSTFVGTNAVLHPVQGLDRGFHRYENWTGARNAFVVPRAIELLRKGDQALTYLPANRQVERVLREWTRGHGSGSFFLVGHFMDPHLPYRDHQGTAGRPDAPEPRRALYPGEVRFVDRALGSLFERMRADGSYDDSWIVLVSDHGEDLYERRPVDHRSGRWFDHGHALTEELVRVPLIIKPPARARAHRPGARRHDLVRSIDVMPTLLAAASAPVPAGLPGHDLLAAGAADTERAALLAGVLWGSPKTALVTGGHKVVHAASDPRLGPWAIFDLQGDVKERRPDRRIDEPWERRLVDRLARLQRSLAAQRRPPVAADPDSEQEELMRKLGYTDEAP